METDFSRPAWDRERSARIAALRSPLVFGTKTNPGWRGKHELLVAAKPPSDIAELLAAESSRIGAAVAASMVFPASAIHSTIAVISIPPRLRGLVSLDEVSDVIAAPVADAASYSNASSPAPILTQYTHLMRSQEAIFAWPETSGLLFERRCALLRLIDEALTDSGLEAINVRGSWAEHITLVRFQKEIPGGSPLLRGLRDALVQWTPTPLFAMGSIELSIVSSDGETTTLDPIITIDLPSVTSTRA
jgi:hypothetical protein